MHVVLISDNRSNPKVIHASENQRRTPCGIYYTRPENLKNYPSIGEMTDVMQITCEKCKTVIAKHLIRESNKEMAAQLKEEQRMLKRERQNAKHGQGMAPAAPAAEQQGGEYIPPSMRKSMSQAQKPIDTPPPPPPAPISIPAPNVTANAPAAATAEDALSQFAVPTSIPGAAPHPAHANDVLSQFAIPGSATAAPAAPVAPQAPINDVLAQFAIPGSAPAAPAAPVAPQPAPQAPINDVLAQFAIPGSATAPAAPAAPAPAAQNDILAQFSMPNPNTGAGSVMDSPQDILAQFASGQPAQAAAPAADAVPTVEAEIDELKTLAANAFARPDKPIDITPVPAVQPVGSVEDSLNDLLLMPSGAGAPKLNQPSTPIVDNIPAVPTVPTAPVMQAPSAPALNIPPVPPAPPVPQMPVPPVQQQPAAPFLNAMQQAAQHPVHNSLFTAPSKLPVQNPNTPMPLFVGYSADGRQVFQTYDVAGNPIPITEPVYSAPPEKPKYNPAAEASAMMNHAIQNNGPVMDMDELMASMGIETPAAKKKKMDSGKPINFTEYKMPEKKQKKKIPASAQSAPMPTLEAMGGPVSAAEAKRRKKVDKINKEFEKQLRSRGIDPRTGGIMLDHNK